MNTLELAHAINAHTPRRLHHHSWLFIALNLILSTATSIPLWIGIWRQLRHPTLIGISIILLCTLVLIAYTLLNYHFYRLQIKDEDLIIHSGIFFKKIRHIPLTNLHNINLRRNPLHRCLNVAEVRLETAGSGGQSEALLRVLSIKDAEHLQHYHLQQQSTAANNLLPLTHSELIRLALSSGQGLGIAALLLYVFFEYQDYDHIAALMAKYLFNSDWLATFLQHWWGMSILLLLALWLLSKLSSLIATYLSYSHFTLLDDGKRLQQQRGSLIQHQRQIRKKRIQVWRIQQNPLMRLFQRKRLVIDTAVLNTHQHSERGISLLIPIADQPTLDRLLNHWGVPQFDNTHPLAKGAWRRIWIGYLLKSAILCLLLAIIVSFISNKIPPQTAAWLWLALLPLQALAAKRRAAFAGWQIQHNHLLYQDGWLWRHWHIMPLAHQHTLSIRHNPFDRRHQMATLIIDSMGSTAYNRPFQIHYLPVKTAKALVNILHQQQRSPNP